MALFERRTIRRTLCTEVCFNQTEQKNTKSESSVAMVEMTSARGLEVKLNYSNIITALSMFAKATAILVCMAVPCI